MMKKDDISLIGYGKTTKAIAEALGNNMVFYDDNVQKVSIDEYSNIIYPSNEFDKDNSKVQILTPSIPPNHQILKTASNPISEYDAILSNNLSIPSLKANPQLDIWISGTNGKTTTTQMVTHLLSEYGAVSGGNIGMPLASIPKDAPIWVLESSSYTLHHTKDAFPNIYLLLPITPDHLNWHKDAKSYIKDKLSPLKRMREGELALIPHGLDTPDTSAWVVEYKNSQDIANFFGIDILKIDFKAGFLMDALMALVVKKVLFDVIDYESINSFKLDKHRQEEIIDKRGRVWVNDSKATNLDATLQAIEAYKDRYIHIILGGDDKGVDMTPLIEKLAKIECTIYTIGSNSQRLYNMAKSKSLKVYECKYLKDAINLIDSKLNKDEVALLSPAASSLDQFPSYAKRGEEFIDFVKNLSLD